MTDLVSIIQELQSADSDVREHAVEALQRKGNKSAVPPLIIALKDMSVGVRGRAAYALGSIGDARAVSHLIEALSDEAGEVRTRAAEALGKIAVAPTKVREGRDVIKVPSAKIRDEYIVPALVSILKSSHNDVRASATEALGQIGTEQATTSIINILNDENKGVRVSAITALKTIGKNRSDIARVAKEKAITGIVGTLNSKYSDVRSDAVAALKEIGGEQAISALTDCLTSPHGSVRQEAARALQTLINVPISTSAIKNQKVERAITALIDALDGEDNAIHIYAGQALGSIGGKRAVTALINGLKSHHISVREVSVESLKNIGKRGASGGEDKEQAVAALIEALDSEAIDVRVKAAEALGEISERRAAPALVRLLRGEDSNLRRRAAEVLGLIGSDEAIPVLITALKDDVDDVRVRAAKALGQLGGEIAVPALIEAINDNVSEVRLKAVSSLGNIVKRDVFGSSLRQINERRSINAAVNQGRRQAVTALTEVLRSPHADVRVIAAGILGDIGGEDVVAALVSALQDNGRERALEESRAFIVHEVRSALGPLRMIAKKLSENLTYPDLNNAKGELMEYAQRILRQTHEAYEVVDQYIAYTTLAPLNPESLEVNKLLEELLSEIGPACANENIEVVQNFGIPCKALIDHGRMKRALRNIFNNAVEAIGRDGQVIISTLGQMENVIITIRDNGPGIKPEYLNSIFSLGFTTKLGKQGTGIGLALAYRIIVEEHNGRLSVANNQGGGGVTVTIQLPASGERRANEN